METEKSWRPPWWKSRTKLERTLCFVTTITLLGACVLAAALAAFSHRCQKRIDTDQEIQTSKKSSHVCLTPGCVKAAREVILNMDESVDPCKDFYGFACGGWMERKSIADDRSVVTLFSEVQDELNLKLKIMLEKPIKQSEPDHIKMLKDMYDTCMDIKSRESAGSKPLQKILKSLGGWPVVEGNKWDGSRFDWVDTLLKLRKLGYSHHILMILYVGIDLKNSSMHIIRLDQTALGMPDRVYYLKGLNDSTTAAYFKMMVESAKKLGANPDTAEEELKKSLDFETTLANFSLPREERRNLSQLYNRYTVKQLHHLTPKVDWLKVFNGLMNDEIREDEPIIVAVPDFVKKFADFISHTDKRVIANYMMWRVTASTLYLLSKEWRDLLQEYLLVLTGETQEEPPWEKCLYSVMGNFAVALSSSYIRHYFKEESKEAAMKMIDYIHKEFLRILDKIDWMDRITKKHAREKALAITPRVGYPPELLNDSYVSNLYSGLSVKNDTYFNNMLRLNKWWVDYYFSKLRKPNIKQEWIKYAGAIYVNAYYRGLENSIIIPAGILQGSYFSIDHPQYMNFGAIGSIIGHEITHGFDDIGRQFDKEGNNVNWWIQKTDELYTRKAKCIINQYSNFTLPEIGFKINGINTQGENIADNGGIKEAYFGYQTWVKDHGPESKLPGLKYTPNQLFWISAANVWCAKYRPEAMKLRIISGAHSPPQFRVIGPMSNFPEFAKDFYCPLGSQMNPHHKCQVW